MACLEIFIALSVCHVLKIADLEERFLVLVHVVLGGGGKEKKLFSILKKMRGAPESFLQP